MAAVNADGAGTPSRKTPRVPAVGQKSSPPTILQGHAESGEDSPARARKATGATTGHGRRLRIAAGGAAAAAIPATPGMVWLIAGRAGALPFLVAAGVLAMATAAVSGAVSMYEARQETRRREIECHSVDAIADALARCIDATHAPAPSPLKAQQAEEAAKVRASALQFLTQAAPAMLPLFPRPPKESPGQGPR
jgi:hypothetical protein